MKRLTAVIAVIALALNCAVCDPIPKKVTYERVPAEEIPNVIERLVKLDFDTILIRPYFDPSGNHENGYYRLTAQKSK